MPPGFIMDTCLPEHINVHFPRPPFGPFTYVLPAGERAVPGARVVVPLGSRRVVGISAGAAAAPAAACKEVYAVLDAEPLLPPHLWELVTFVSARYAASVGETLRLALPLSLDESRDDLVILTSAFATAPDMATFTAEEAAVIGAVWEAGWLGRRAAGDGGVVRALAARGVVAFEPQTTRPPTDDVVVYAAAAHPRRRGKAAAAALDALMAGPQPLRRLWEEASSRRGVRELLGARAAVLALCPPPSVPPTGDRPRRELLLAEGDAALSRAMAELEAASPPAIIVVVPELYRVEPVRRSCEEYGGAAFFAYHSDLPAGARWELWRRAKRGTVRRVVGTPGALFLPLPSDAAVVVVDEGDHAYKGWERAPYYHAREVALARAAGAGGGSPGAVIVTGGAPTLESYAAAKNGAFELVRAPSAADAGDVTVVDMNEVVAREGAVIFSAALTAALQDAFAAGGRVVLVVNRRGYIPHFYCGTCGRTLRCGQCDVAFAYHKDEEVLRCHYCLRREPLPARCPACGKAMFVGVGFGSEKLAAEAALVLPRARVARADSDALATPARARSFWDAWAKGDFDVVVGTQMALRAVEDAAVACAALVNADTAMNLPDFRGAEATYRVIRRLVAGARPGRRTIIQTFFPGHYAVAAAVRDDYEGFAQAELAFRKSLRLPPFTHLINITVTAASPAAADALAAQTYDAVAAAFGPRAELLGPMPAAVGLIRARWRRQLLVKTDVPAIMAAAPTLSRLTMRKRDAAVTVDVDPYELF